MPYDQDQNEELDYARRVADRLIFRAEQNEEFAATLKADPGRALLEAGVSEKTAAELMRRPERANDRCVDTTCWVSLCPGTCFITIHGPIVIVIEPSE